MPNIEIVDGLVNLYLGIHADWLVLHDRLKQRPPSDLQVSDAYGPCNPNSHHFRIQPYGAKAQVSGTGPECDASQRSVLASTERPRYRKSTDLSPDARPGM